MNSLPGISILKYGLPFSANSKSDNGPAQESLILNALEYVLHDDRYSNCILLKKNTLWVACTRYPEYPIAVHEDEHFWVCIEGKIYGQDDTQIKNEINALLCEISRSDKSGEEPRIAVDKWLSTTDGEFVIYALNKLNEEFIVLK